MPYEPDVQVSFVLTSNSRSSVEIASAIALKPTQRWDIGDCVQGTRLVRRVSGWVFSTPSRATFDVEGEVVSLLDAVDQTSIREVAQVLALDVEVSCDVRVTAQAPALHFSAATLRRIALYNCSIDVDVIMSE